MGCMPKTIPEADAVERHEWPKIDFVTVDGDVCAVVYDHIKDKVYLSPDR